MNMEQLSKHTHVHGLAVDRSDPDHLLIATHHGLFRTRSDGKAERISEVQDFMGFSPHPRAPNILYASGHPERGGNLGFIESKDGGRTWTQISAGANGPVDFHQMTVSPADPSRIYGVFRGLQVSRDGGRTWKVEGRTPDKLIGLSASAKDADMIYAATEEGLFASTDAGNTWNPLLKGSPVTFVKATEAGALYAYVVGRGLVSAREPPAAFRTVTAAFGDDYVVHFAADPTNPDRLFAATRKGNIIASADAGRTWQPLGSGS